MVELPSPRARLELWLSMLPPLGAFVVTAEDCDAELTFPDVEAEDGAAELELAVPDVKVDVMELTLVVAAAVFVVEVPRYDVSSVVVFDAAALPSDGLAELDDPGPGDLDPEGDDGAADEDVADEDVVDVTLADGWLVDKSVDPISESLESELLSKTKINFNQKFLSVFKNYSSPRLRGRKLKILLTETARWFPGAIGVPVTRQSRIGMLQ